MAKMYLNPNFELKIMTKVFKVEYGKIDLGVYIQVYTQVYIQVYIQAMCRLYPKYRNM